jgi:hypothetical protein
MWKNKLHMLRGRVSPMLASSHVPLRNINELICFCWCVKWRWFVIIYRSINIQKPMLVFNWKMLLLGFLFHWLWNENDKVYLSCDIMLKIKSICSSCMEGKHSCENIIKIVECCTTSFVVFIHFDLCGMIHCVSLGGAHYSSISHGYVFWRKSFKHYKHLRIFIPRWNCNLLLSSCWFYATITSENMSQESFLPFALK